MIGIRPIRFARVRHPEEMYTCYAHVRGDAEPATVVGMRVAGQVATILSEDCMTATTKPELSLAGRKLRWTFHEGPTANKTYEHTFNDDGTVVFREVGGAPAKQAEPSGNSKSPIHYASYEVAPGLHFMSYLSPDSGYTLTVLVDLNKHVVHAVASGGKEWYPLVGTLDSAD